MQQESQLNETKMIGESHKKHEKNIKTLREIVSR